MFCRVPAKFLCVSVVLSLAACASEPSAPNPGLKESFHTEISANGSKRFTYALEMAAPQLRGPYTENPTTRRGILREQEMMRRQPRAGRSVNFDHALELKLQESGFCRDGYFVIERVVSQMGGEVRGECRDAAAGREGAPR